MPTKQINDELFEVILKNAFSESFNRELERYESSATTLSDAVPSKEHKKCAQKAYRKKMHKPFDCVAALQKITASILIVFSIWNALMLCSPTVQAAVKDTIVEFFDKYISFDFSKNDDFIVIGTHKVGYIPSGYQLTETKTTQRYEKYIFSNGIDDINLRIMSSGISEVGVDSENRKMQPIKVKDYVAYALLHNDSDEPTVVIWGDENCSFLLTAKLNLTELNKIANSFE